MIDISFEIRRDELVKVVSTVKEDGEVIKTFVELVEDSTGYESIYSGLLITTKYLFDNNTYGKQIKIHLKNMVIIDNINNLTRKIKDRAPYEYVKKLKEHNIVVATYIGKKNVSVAKPKTDDIIELRVQEQAKQLIQKIFTEPELLKRNDEDRLKKIYRQLKNNKFIKKNDIKFMNNIIERSKYE
jgi:hypothetical protein